WGAENERGGGYRRGQGFPCLGAAHEGCMVGEDLEQGAGHVGPDHGADVDTVGRSFSGMVVRCQGYRLYSAVASIEEVDIHGGWRGGLGKMSFESQPFAGVIFV